MKSKLKSSIIFVYAKLRGTKILVSPIVLILRVFGLEARVRNIVVQPPVSNNMIQGVPTEAPSYLYEPKRAWVERLVSQRNQLEQVPLLLGNPKTLRLFIVGPVPPARSGVASYSYKLAIELAKYYEIILVSDNFDVWSEGFQHVSPVEFLNMRKVDEPVLYHFGNSPFHDFMEDLLEKVPGVVDLHDVSLRSLHVWRNDWNLHAPELIARMRQELEPGTLQDLPKTIDDVGDMSAKVVFLAKQLIVHNPEAKRRVLESNRDLDDCEISVIPLSRSSRPEAERDRKRIGVQIPKDEFVIVSLGFPDPTKLSYELLSALGDYVLKATTSSPIHLVFVGELGEGDYRNQLIELSESLVPKIRMTITGWVSDDEYADYLNRANLCVQLRRNSHGESSAAILDCLFSGKPLMISDTAENMSIPENTVFKINNSNLPAELSRALLDRSDHPTKALNARSYAETELSLELNAQKYIGLLEKSLSDEKHFKKMEERSKNFRTIYVDVSAVFANDLGTGIQRVVKQILFELFRAPDTKFSIVPVYFDISQNSFFSAESLVANLMDWGKHIFRPREVRPYEGDIFLGLDLAFSDIAHGCLSRWHRSGVQVYFMVHDLLPVTHPQFFPEYAVEKFRGWLEMTSLYDGVVANSKTTLLEYLAHFPDLPKDFARGSFPLGCDFESNLPDVLERGEGVVTRSDLHFLLIGTIEPRKGHLDALKAFQVLWGRGYTGRLTVVGRWGWGVMDVRERLEEEARINPRLRILNNAGDQELEKIYRTGDCLLAVSECEGFGIPIIEAASRGVSVLARDIPVFREVAGDGADFLSDQEPWPDQILKWDSAFRSKQSANPEDVPYQSWNESSQILMKLILDFDSRARP